MKQGKSFIGWVGGKSQLTDTIIPLMLNHKAYVEVFAGAAWLLFRKPASDVEIINDINRDLTTLYRVIQHHLEEFVRYFKWVLISREEFERFKALDAGQMTDIQRAVRFYYLVKMGFGARITNPSFGISVSRPPRLNLLRIEEDLSAAHLRLARVQVDNRPYQECLSRFDRADTLFYLDPPYYGCEDDYGKQIFARSDFQSLNDQLETVKGKWLVSINDVPEIRKIFSNWHIKPVQTRYTLASQAPKQAKELLIANFKMK